MADKDKCFPVSRHGKIGGTDQIFCPVCFPAPLWEKALSYQVKIRYNGVVFRSILSLATTEREVCCGLFSCPPPQNGNYAVNKVWHVPRE